MKQKFSIFLIAVMVLMMVPSAAIPVLAAENWVYEAPADGSWMNGKTGTSESDAIVITTPQQLAYMAYQVNEDNDNYGSLYYKLGGNIDLGGSANGNWTPIGGSSNYFYGSFDGDGFTISNLYTNAQARDLGLFGYIGSTGTVKNVGLVGTEIIGTRTSGGIAAFNYGTIQYCFNTGNITGYGGTVVTYGTGGIAGFSSKSISNCFNTGSISSQFSTGGIVGLLKAGTDVTVENCYNTGNLTGSDSACGGIIGNFCATASGVTCQVRNCYDTGDRLASNQVGGIVGHLSGVNTPSSITLQISNCLSLGLKGSSTASMAIHAYQGRIFGEVNRSATGNYPTFTDNYARSDQKIGQSSQEAVITDGTASNKNGESVAVDGSVTVTNAFSAWSSSGAWSIPSNALSGGCNLPTLTGMPAGVAQNPTLPGEGKTDVSNSITFADDAKTYNGGSQAITAATFGGTKDSNDSMTYSYVGKNGTSYTASSTPPVNAGTYDVTATYEDDTQRGTKKVTYTISKATLTITAENKAIAVGDSEPPYTYTTDGLGTGDSLSTEPTITCPTADTGTLGTYPIVPEGAAVTNSGNYNSIQYVEGTLTVANEVYTLTVEAGTGGTASGSGNYSPDTSVSILATPESNYSFSGWTSSNGGTFANAGSASTTFTMPGSNTTITANFTQNAGGDPTAQAKQEEPVYSHEHYYRWVMVSDASLNADGMEQYICSCGKVKETLIIPASQVYIKGIYGEIKDAPEGARITYDSGRWTGISDYVIRKLADRPDVSVVITFEHKNQNYTFTLPAGISYELLMHDEETYYGFFTFCDLLGIPVSQLD